MINRKIRGKTKMLSGVVALATILALALTLALAACALLNQALLLYS